MPDTRDDATPDSPQHERPAVANPGAAQRALERRRAAAAPPTLPTPDDDYDAMIVEATRRVLDHLATLDAQRDAQRQRGETPVDAVDPFADVSAGTRRAYLRAFAACGHKGRAARAVGINPSTPRSRPWKEDREYMEALPEAEALAAEMLEAEAMRRAVDGTVVPVGWYKGEPGGYVREYSDTLLALLLKAHNPAKYGDKLSVRGTMGHYNLDQWPDWAVERVRTGDHPDEVLDAMRRRALAPGRQVGEQGADD